MKIGKGPPQRADPLPICFRTTDEDYSGLTLRVYFALEIVGRYPLLKPVKSASIDGFNVIPDYNHVSL